MRRLSRRQMVLTAIAASLSPSVALTQNAAAQGSIPDGVFVRESNGTVWLVLGGQRVAVAFWPAEDAEIAALAPSGRWAVMNEAGGMVAGGRPAWHTEEPLHARSGPAAAMPPPMAVRPTSALPSMIAAQPPGEIPSLIGGPPPATAPSPGVSQPSAATVADSPPGQAQDGTCQPDLH